MWSLHRSESGAELNFTSLYSQTDVRSSQRCDATSTTCEPTPIRRTVSVAKHDKGSPRGDGSGHHVAAIHDARCRPLGLGVCHLQAGLKKELCAQPGVCNSDCNPGTLPRRQPPRHRPHCLRVRDIVTPLLRLARLEKALAWPGMLASLHAICRARE